jgi:hypothetical protein
MPLRTLLILLLFPSVFTISASSQSKHGTNAHILARLAYHSTFGRDSGGDRTCFAVFEDGFYRFSRQGLDVEADLLGNRLVVQGRLSPLQLARVKSMLRKLTGESAGGDIVLEEAESFTAEFKQDGELAQFTWAIADRRKSFPPAVSGLVKWLEDFKAENSHALRLREMSDLPLCPPVTTKPAQPEIAGLKP